MKNLENKIPKDFKEQYCKRTGKKNCEYWSSNECERSCNFANNIYEFCKVEYKNIKLNQVV